MPARSARAVRRTGKTAPVSDQARAEKLDAILDDFEAQGEVLGHTNPQRNPPASWADLGDLLARCAVLCRCEDMQKDCRDACAEIERMYRVRLATVAPEVRGPKVASLPEEYVMQPCLDFKALSAATGQEDEDERRAEGRHSQEQRIHIIQ